METKELQEMKEQMALLKDTLRQEQQALAYKVEYFNVFTVEGGW